IKPALEPLTGLRDDHDRSRDQERRRLLQVRKAPVGLACRRIEARDHALAANHEDTQGGAVARRTGQYRGSDHRTAHRRLPAQLALLAIQAVTVAVAATEVNRILVHG